MGSGKSKPKKTGEPAVDDPWEGDDADPTLKSEAMRIFKLADKDGNGTLDIDEIKETLKKPQFADTVMENLDINLDGQVSITEWMIAQKSTFQKSKPGCATALKAMEKGACVHETEILLPLPRLRRLHSHTRAFCRSCSQPSSTTDRNCC